MKRHGRLIAQFSIVLGFFGYATNGRAQINTSVRALEPGHWEFIGSLSPQSIFRLESLIRAAKPTPLSILDITSAGGDAISSIGLAEFLRERNISIRVPKLCASACAQYIFIGARRRFVSPHAVVLFHGSPTLLFNVYRDSGREAEAQLFAPGAAIERSLYRKAGITIAFDRLAQQGLMPICLAINDQMLSGSPNRYNLLTRFVTYTISRRTLLEGNVKIYGYWPKDEVELIANIHNLSFRSSFSATFVDEDSQLKFKARKLHLKQCSGPFS